MTDDGTTRLVDVTQTVEPSGATPDDVLDLLARTTLFRRVRRSDLAAFVALVDGTGPDAGRARRTLKAGEVLFDVGDRADALVVILSGLFEERSAVDRGLLLWESAPGDVVGETALFADEPQSDHELADEDADRQHRRRSAVVCVEPGEVFVISQEATEAFAERSPAFMRGLLRSVATDAARLMDDEREDAEILQAYFDGATARLVPAPYLARDVTMTIVYGRAPDGDFARYLPDGVRAFPFLRDTFLLVFADFPRLVQPFRPAAPPFCYRETAVFVAANRAIGPVPISLPFAYAPAVYPDGVMAMTLGREIYGFRKRTAQTYIDDDRQRLRLVLDGAQVARATYEDDGAPLEAFWEDAPGAITLVGLLLRKLGIGSAPAFRQILNGLLAVPGLNRVPVVNLKQIPGPGHADGRTRYEVNELCTSPFRLNRVHSIETLTGVDLRMEGNVPFAGADAAAPVGLRIRCDFDLLTGRVLHRYRRRREPLPAAREPIASGRGGTG